MKSMIAAFALLSLLAVSFAAEVAVEPLDFPKVDFAQYTGELILEQSGDKVVRSMFYWQQSSRRNNRTDPIIFWISGGANGPGCSSLISMFRGLGGVYLRERESIFMYEAEDALNSNATVVYLEAPSGVGFSRRAVKVAPNWTYYDTAYEVKDAIIKYFEKFPEFKGNDVYIAGEGWSGVVVPRVVELFQLEKQAQKEAGNLKIKGAIIGNGEMDSDVFHREKNRHDFLWGHSLYNIEIREIITGVCQTHPSTPRCTFAKETINRLTRDINPFDVHGNCYRSADQGEYQQPGWVPCHDYANLYEYFKRPEVRQSLGLNSDKIWVPCDSEVFSTYGTPDSAIKNLVPLLDQGYRILYYSGDLDSTYPFNEAFRWIPKLNLGVEKGWREWIPYGRVAGHVINYNKNFTFATVRGAGMNTYIRKRKETNWLLNRFLEGKNPDQ